LVEFGLALVQWLEPYHIPIKHTVMTSAVAALEAARAAPAKRIETAGKKGGTKKATNGAAAATSAENGTGEQLDEHGFIVTGGPKVPTGMLTLQEPVDVPEIPEGLAESASKEPPENISVFFEGTVAGWNTEPLKSSLVHLQIPRSCSKKLSQKRVLFPGRFCMSPNSRMR
jgi:hypothetical protein